MATYSPSLTAGLIQQTPGHDSRVFTILPAVDRVLSIYDLPQVIFVDLPGV